MKWKAIWIAGAAAVVLSSAANAQTAITKTLTAPVTETVTIQAIDQTDRLLTVKNAKGDESVVYASPDVKRFAELKVGQQVQIRYYESVVFQVAKPDRKTAALKEADAVTPSKGAAPGGTIARQLTATVDVVAVNSSVPSITVKTAAGRTITRKVEDAKHLAGIKPGDRIVITYTEAALLQVQ